MKKFTFICLAFFCLPFANAQNLYFPPLTGNTWDTISTVQLGWCPDKVDTLLQFLEVENTKAFIVLKDGKIVIEHYFDAFTVDSLWYWASAGKSLTAFLTGLAQEQNYLSINDTTSNYLGAAWTSCTPTQEEKITVLNQLTMTSGLDDFWGGDSDCTHDTCLYYKADAGTRWAYHNAPYTLTEQVVSTATGLSYNQWTNSEMKMKTGMDGFWLPLGFNNVYFSTPRSMARFGLVMLNNGIWNADTIMHDSMYFNQMINSSQTLNESYGYLWWLNGKNTFMIPGLQFVFNGSITPNAPADMYAAMGKNGQLLNVVPSENLIVVRMGDNPNNSLVPVAFQNEMWEKLNDVMCFTTVQEMENNFIHVYPNPVTYILNINLKNENAQNYSATILDLYGRTVSEHGHVNKIDTNHLQSDIYFLKLEQDGAIYTQKFIKF